MCLDSLKVLLISYSRETGTWLTSPVLGQTETMYLRSNAWTAHFCASPPKMCNLKLIITNPNERHFPKWLLSKSTTIKTKAQVRKKEKAQETVVEA